MHNDKIYLQSNNYNSRNTWIIDDNAARDKKKARFISSITSKSLLKLAI